MIRKCTCEHKPQDKLHGVGRRVMNEYGPPTDRSGYRCTVCGREHLTGVEKK